MWGVDLESVVVAFSSNFQQSSKNETLGFDNILKHIDCICAKLTDFINHQHFNLHR